MNKGLVALTGIGLGVGAMYFADPIQGRRRRARLRDAAIHAASTARGAALTTCRDIENRVSGLAARTRSRISGEEPPSDEVLGARVRSRLGRLLSHPGAIDVSASQGVVTLRGPVFSAEVGQLVSGVAEVPGVTAVDNQLEPHERAGDVPALQGPGPLVLPRAPATWLRWTPTMRALTGAAGVALMAFASRQPRIPGAAAGLAGFELLERAALGGPKGKW
jgi:osmotically-inducible protein OsmY